MNKKYKKGERIEKFDKWAKERKEAQTNLPCCYCYFPKGYCEKCGYVWWEEVEIDE